jgi:hypothetical protein
MKLMKILNEPAAWRWLLGLCFLVSGAKVITLAQVKQANRSLVVNGQTGEAPVIQMNGRVYVDLGA